MTTKFGNVLVLAPEEDRKCCFCGAVSECRPYGPGGKNICFECAMNDHKEVVESNFGKLHNGE